MLIFYFVQLEQAVGKITSASDFQLSTKKKEPQADSPVLFNWKALSLFIEWNSSES